MAANESRPRFEPPPWEKEAFERFRREQDPPREEGGQDGAPAMAPATAAEEKAADGIVTPAAVAGVGRVPDARVEQMLLQLRYEEPEAQPVHTAVVNTVAALLVAGGLGAAIEAIVLFVRAGAQDAIATLVVGTISFVMLATGGGLVAGGVMLFKKYHR